MNQRSSKSLALGLFAVVCATLVSTIDVAASNTIQSQAVVRLSFDEKTGDAIDTAAGGKQSNNGKLINGVQRVMSPFWGQPGGRALLLNAARKQFVQIADSPDVDRSDAVSFSFFFLSLHNPGDAAFHGVVAKRAADKAAVSNYGINYSPKSDALQLYVNDGSGFRTATFSVKNAIGFRRRAFLTATWQAADAPAPDKDNDKDDVVIRLYVNGNQIKPTKVGKAAQIAGNDAWMTNVKIAGLLNNAPVTLGGSTTTSEFTSCVIDEFSLFSRALSADEVAKLFIETAGSTGPELAKQELQPAPAAAQGPAITSISQRGLQLGQANKLTIDGKNLTPQPTVALPIGSLKQTVQKGSNANRLIVELTLPKDAAAGFYPLRVQTANGVSNALAIAVDPLPQRTAAVSSPDKPVSLPAAFSGTLSGAAQQRLYFRGKQGQRIVADVEARRLGAAMEPVLEVKNDKGAPLIIEWGKVYLRGDTRAEVTIPADGLYYVELHDLSYKAPVQSPFRLKIGDLKLVDTIFPPAAIGGTEVSFEPIGTGFPPGTTFKASLNPNSSGLAELLTLSPSLGASGPAPAIRRSDGVEVLEAKPADGKPQTIDARFAKSKTTPITINGRISKPGERDLYLLDVTPGQSLNFSIAARSINSPLDAELSVLWKGTVQIVKEDQPGSRDPAFNYQVPKENKQIQVAVRDLFGRGGPHFLYRLRMTPAGRPSFRMNLLTGQVNLPENGMGVLQLQINRSRYNGAIQLKVAGDEKISISPSQIPAGVSNKVFVTLTRKGGDNAIGLRQLRIVGESAGLKPAIRAVATLSVQPGKVSIPGYQDVLPAGVTAPIGLLVDVVETPKTLLKGINSEIALAVNRVAGQANSGAAVKLTLMSTEAPRRADPRNPKKGNKPLVRAAANQSIVGSASSGTLKIAVPADVAEGAINFVVRADVVPHAYAQQILATTYSKPFRLTLTNAVSVTLVPKSLNLTAESENKVSGTLKRTAGFNGGVDVALINLPKGYTSTKASVPAGKQSFQLTVKAGNPNEDRALTLVRLRVTATGGGALLPDRPVKFKVTAAK